MYLVILSVSGQMNNVLVPIRTEKGVNEAKNLY